MNRYDILLGKTPLEKDKPEYGESPVLTFAIMNKMMKNLSLPKRGVFPPLFTNMIRPETKKMIL